MKRGRSSPASCATTSIGEVCICPDNPNGFSLTLDFGEPPAVVLTTGPNGSEVALFQPRAVANVPVNVDMPLLGIQSCLVSYDTERTGAPTLDISGEFLFTTDEFSGTQVQIRSLDMTLESDDFEITGCALGGVAEVALGFVVGQMETTLENRARAALEQSFQAMVCAP